MIRSNVTAWNIDTLNILECDAATIFDRAHVYFNRQIIKSIFQGHNEVSLGSLIIFKPHRLLLHQLIVDFSIYVRFASESTFQELLLSQYEQVVTVFGEALEQLELSNEELKVTNIDELIALEKKYAQKALPEIKEISRLVINEFLKTNKNLEVIIPEPHKRTTAMIVGGQASGKGSSVGLLKHKMESMGINWLDFVRINTDSYKPLVLKPGSVDPFYYSQIAQPEASIIHQKLFKRLKELAEEESRAPHVLVDQVFLGEDKLQYALLNDGQAIVAVVSTEVITAVERSFHRGMATQPPEYGRFEDTKGILRCHKRFAMQLPETLAKYVDSNTQATILDNNVILGEDPECAAVIFLGRENKHITILSKEAIKNFIKKTRINENAASASEVYQKALSIDDEEIRNYFSQLNVEIKFEIAERASFEP